MEIFVVIFVVDGSYENVHVHSLLGLMWYGIMHSYKNDLSYEIFITRNMYRYNEKFSLLWWTYFCPGSVHKQGRILRFLGHLTVAANIQISD